MTQVLRYKVAAMAQLSLEDAASLLAFRVKQANSLIKLAEEPGVLDNIRNFFTNPRGEDAISPPPAKPAAPAAPATPEAPPAPMKSHENWLQANLGSNAAESLRNAAIGAGVGGLGNLAMDMFRKKRDRKGLGGALQGGLMGGMLGGFGTLGLRSYQDYAQNKEQTDKPQRIAATKQTASDNFTGGASVEEKQKAMDDRNAKLKSEGVAAPESGGIVGALKQQGKALTEVPGDVVNLKIPTALGKTFGNIDDPSTLIGGGVGLASGLSARNRIAARALRDNPVTGKPPPSYEHAEKAVNTSGPVVSAAKAVAHPIQTAKAVGSAIRHPIQTTKNVVGNMTANSAMRNQAISKNLMSRGSRYALPAVTTLFGAGAGHFLGSAAENATHGFTN